MLRDCLSSAALLALSICRSTSFLPPSPVFVLLSSPKDLDKLTKEWAFSLPTVTRPEMKNEVREAASAAVAVAAVVPSFCRHFCVLLPFVMSANFAASVPLSGSVTDAGKALFFTLSLLASSFFVRSTPRLSHAWDLLLNFLPFSRLASLALHSMSLLHN